MEEETPQPLYKETHGEASPNPVEDDELCVRCSMKVFSEGAVLRGGDCASFFVNLALLLGQDG